MAGGLRRLHRNRQRRQPHVFALLLGLGLVFWRCSHALNPWLQPVVPRQSKTIHPCSSKAFETKAFSMQHARSRGDQGGYGGYSAYSSTTVASLISDFPFPLCGLRAGLKNASCLKGRWCERRGIYSLAGGSIKKKASQTQSTANTSFKKHVVIREATAATTQAPPV